MNYLISAIEIALLILVPLIKFYQWRNWTYKQYIKQIGLLYLIWFFSYAGMHELSHLFGSWITGTKILDYQLITPFWKGDFKTAYVNSQFENKTQTLISLIMPYLRDMILLLIGYWILIRKRIHSYFLTGLILILFALSPLFDIINNYSGFIFLYSGDFNELSKVVGVMFTNAIGLIFSLMAIVTTVRILMICKNYPLSKKE